MLHVEVGRRAASIAEGSLVGAAFRGSGGGRHDGEKEGWMDGCAHSPKQGSRLSACPGSYGMR